MQKLALMLRIVFALIIRLFFQMTLGINSDMKMLMLILIP